jgi:RNA 2',3'-cyclic 3'-phosphodiesterase
MEDHQNTYKQRGIVMSGKSLRLFTAVPLPGSIRHQLSEWTSANKKHYPFQKWAHPDDVHITLVFMGDTEENKIPAIKDDLQASVTTLSPFTLSLTGIGTFGPPAAPSILWTGLEGQMERLTELQKAVQAALVGLGFPKEDRPYRPHITLARRYNGSTPWSQVRSKLSVPFPLSGTEWTCDRIILFLSHLGRSPMYESIGEFTLS